MQSGEGRCALVVAAADDLWVKRFMPDLRSVWD